MAVCSEIHTKHINTLCGQNGELLTVKPGGTYSYHCATVERLTTLYIRLPVGFPQPHAARQQRSTDCLRASPSPTSGRLS